MRRPREGFSEFYRLEYPNTVRLAFLLTGSDSVCEEIAQEGFTAVFERFDGLDRPAAYLRTTVVNGCQRWHRSRSIHSAKLDLLTLPADDPGPGRGRDVVDIVAKLPYRQRLVVVGRYWAGWSESEIAETLGCPLGTVKSLASRALDSIRREVGQP